VGGGELVKRLRVVHRTGFRYQGEVQASYNEARMLPASRDGQLVLSATLDIEPVTSHHDYRDYWGTRVSAFEVLTAHSELALTARSLVEVGGRPGLGESMGWDDLAAESLRTVEHVEQAGQTPRTEPPQDVAEQARAIASACDGPGDAARSICEWVGDSMEYMQGVTGVQSTGAEAWAERRGVCQDIVHVALGALRSVGIPARYVSGYLHPRRAAVIGETVTGESHAWVEWFCGDWHGYDPTNQLDVDDHHVIVGRGRDYVDVAPLRGVYAGPNGSELFVEVSITREA
jgi:transglutaminase-like putative cysteine protease